MVKIGDKFQRDNKQYVVVGVGVRTIRARRYMKGVAVGYNVVSFPKKDFK